MRLALCFCCWNLRSTVWQMRRRDACKVGRARTNKLTKMIWNPWAHHAGNHKKGLEPMGVLQEQLSHWQCSAELKPGVSKAEGGPRRRGWGAVAGLLLSHSAGVPGNWQFVRATKAPAPASREQSLLPSHPPNQGKIFTVSNRSLKSSKAAPIYRNGFLQKWKTLFGVKCSKLRELWENI